MTQNDIFRLAVEAGAYWEHGDWNMPSAVTFSKESQLVEFAQLILDHQREACPPKREWQGLTEDEINECFKITPDLFLPWHIYKRIEEKLKERNT